MRDSTVAAKTEFEQKCYEAYKLDWMISHGLSLHNYLLGLAEDLTQTDDRIEKLLELGYTNADFYGDKRDLRYSEAVGDN